MQLRDLEGEEGLHNQLLKTIFILYYELHNNNDLYLICTFITFIVIVITTDSSMGV